MWARLLTTAITALLLQPAPPPPNLRAQWDSATSATISWHQTTRGCLYVEHANNWRVFVSCYEKPGSYRVQFGHVGPLSGDQRPAAGDVWVLVMGGQKYSAPLRGRPVYFPVFRG